MGTVTAGTIIDKAASQLIDIAGVRWTRAELLKSLNDGLRQIVLMQPTATNTPVAVKLTAGTRQLLPTGGWLLLGIYRNMGTTGTTPGRAVRVISRELIDGFNPSWHTATASAVTQNYIYDLQDQTAYYVYPPSTGTNYLEINYSLQPTDLTSESQVIPMFDVYQMPLLDYIMYRACTKDAEYAPGVTLGQMYLTTFTASVGVKEQSEIKSGPEQSLLPRNPNVGGSMS
jgi:hypothetical protein